MIVLYSGTPGSGKSLHIAERIYWRLRTGKPVIANFEFNDQRARGRKRGGGEFIYKDNEELRPEWLRDYATDYFKSHKFHEDQILLVIDEAQLMFNAREWSAEGRKEWLSFFTQHRKFGYKIVLVAQFDRMLDRQIRSLLEYELIHRKVSNFGFWGKLLSVVALGKMFCAVKMWYPLREKVGAEWFIAKRKYYSLYDTYNKFDDADGNEKVQKSFAGRADRRAWIKPASQENSEAVITDNGVKFYEVS